MTSPPIRHYAVEEVAPGVHAAIALREGWGVSNSGLVDLGEGTMVFDTGMTPAAAQELVRETQGHLGRAPSLVANSHWHFDHSMGNQEFPSIPIWATRRTREIVLENQAQFAADLTQESLAKEIAELEVQRTRATNETVQADIDFNLHMIRALLAFAGRNRVAPADHTFESQLDLPGSRGARLLTFGRGHTDADALLYLPHEKVLFAGDLVALGIQPSMASGDPDHWLVELDEIERVGPERIVPGHGPVTNVDGLSEIRGYLSGVLRAAEAPRDAPLPAAIQRWEGTVSLNYNLEFARTWVAHRTP